jgi:chemotaxis protein MotB
LARDKGKTIVIVKKKRGHGGGHHGGSWKVAYADFVTAMMAFFLVMWILGMDEGARSAVEGYFSNPVGYEKGYSSGNSPISSGNSPGQVQSQPIRLILRAREQERFESAGARIKAAVRENTALRQMAARVEVITTPQGLRIELVEGRDGETFFGFGSKELKPAARLILQIIALELNELSNPLVVEGHTDAAQFGSAAYTNWELSADRANAARRTLEQFGVSGDRIREVRGYADTQPRDPQRPLDPSNRRISILLPFSSPALELDDAPQPAAGVT